MIVAANISTPGLSAIDLQTTAICRRLRLSPSAARTYADHAFGAGQRSDFSYLAALTASRVASGMEVQP